MQVVTPWKIKKLTPAQDEKAPPAGEAVKNTLRAWRKRRSRACEKATAGG